jgi:hypothetical protein
MPATASLTIPDPPPVPAGYALTAFEVREIECRSLAGSVVAFGAADLDATATALLAYAVRRLAVAAVAWWEGPLDGCKPGKERVVSVYDLDRGRWSAWRVESVVGGRQQRHGTQGA